MVVKFKLEGFSLDDNVEGVSEKNVSESIRFGVIEAMILLDQRLNRIVRTWKQENKPYFVSTVSIEKQIGTEEMDRDGIEFYLDNAQIWNWLDRGVPAHKIRARSTLPKQVGRGKSGFRLGGGILAFTGWSQGIDSTGILESQIQGRVGVRKFRRKDGSIGFRTRDTGLLGRFRAAQERTGSFPPTYLPSTRPGRLAAGKSEHLGNRRKSNGNPVVVMPNSLFGRASVNHPGIEPRNISQRLLYGGGSVVSVQNRFISSVSARLNELEDRTISRVRRSHLPSGGIKQREEQVFAPGGRRLRGAYNIQRYLDAREELLRGGER